MPFARAADIDILAVPIEGCAGGGLHVGIWTPLGGVKTGSMDIAILIHGGGFSMGDYQDIPTTDVEYYNKEGFVVVSPQYRLAPHVRMPQIAEDTARIYEWIHNGLVDHVVGARSVGKIIISGWSAGAACAIFMTHFGVGRGLPPPSAVIVGYGCFDASTMKSRPYEEIMASLDAEDRDFAMRVFEEEPSAGVRHPPAPKGPGLQIPPADTPRLAWLLPLMKGSALHSYLYDQAEPPFSRQYTPIHLIDSSFPPTFVLVAGADRLLPVLQSTDFLQALQTRGVECQSATAHGMPHGKCENWDEEVDTDYPRWWNEAIEPSIRWAISVARR